MLAAGLLWLILSLVVSSCSDRPQQSEPPVRVGCLLPLSGDAATWGVSMKEGIDLAAADLNAERLPPRKRIELRYEDDRGLPRDGVSAVEKLLDVDHVRALMGVANSSVALAVVPIIDSKNVVFVSGGASSPKLSGASKFFFRTWPSDIAEAVAMARYARGKLGLERIAVLYINNEYGVGLRDPFKQEFAAHGGSVVAEEAFPQEATDFRTQLVTIHNTNAQAVYLIGNPREMGRALKQAAELELHTQFLSTSALVDREVINIAGPAAEGVILTDASFDPSSTNPETQKFLSRFKQRYAKDPGMLAVTGYDALQVVVHAFDATDGTGKQMAEWLGKLRGFAGAAGPISFDQNGDVSRPVRISIVKDGKFVTKAYLQ